MIKYGPYIVVKNLKTREFKDKNVSKKCPNPKCSEYNKNAYDRYCSNCGYAIFKKSSEKISKRKPIRGEDFLKRETLLSLDSKQTILVPNKKWMSTDLVFEKCRNNDNEFVVEMGYLDYDDISDEISLFEQAFEKELKELRENYESVEVKFGLVNCNYY